MEYPEISLMIFKAKELCYSWILPGLFCPELNWVLWFNKEKGAISWNLNISKYVLRNSYNIIMLQDIIEMLLEAHTLPLFNFS